jgi:DNA-directed RNA polymerase subunit M/transcription elongation factor TFIIS
MPIAKKVEERCPRCDDSSDVWMFEKLEGTGIKECYTCDSCGAEWPEISFVK